MFVSNIRFANGDNDLACNFLSFFLEREFESESGREIMFFCGRSCRDFHQIIFV